MMPNIINEETLAHPLRRQLFSFFAPRLNFTEIPSPWQKLFYNPETETKVFDTAIALFELAHSHDHTLQDEIAWFEHMMMYFHYFIAHLYFKEKYPTASDISRINVIKTIFKTFLEKTKKDYDHLSQYLNSTQNKFDAFFTKFIPEEDEIERRFRSELKFPRGSFTEPKFDFFYKYLLSKELRQFCINNLETLKEPFKSLFGTLPSPFFTEDFELVQIFFSEHLSGALVDLNQLFLENSNSYNLLTLRYKSKTGQEVQASLPAVTAAHRHLTKLMLIYPTPHSLAIACNTLMRMTATSSPTENPTIFNFIQSQLTNLQEMRVFLISLYGSIGMMILSVSSSLMFYLEREKEVYYRQTFLYLALALQLNETSRSITHEFFASQKLQTPLLAFCRMIAGKSSPGNIRETLAALDDALVNKGPIDFIYECNRARTENIYFECQKIFSSSPHQAACSFK